MSVHEKPTEPDLATRVLSNEQRFEGLQQRIDLLTETAKRLILAQQRQWNLIYELTSPDTYAFRHAVAAAGMDDLEQISEHLEATEPGGPDRES